MGNAVLFDGAKFGEDGSFLPSQKGLSVTIESTCRWELITHWYMICVIPNENDDSGNDDHDGRRELN